jgi:glycosyltransferase involved in cell wall biosynthesis
MLFVEAIARAREGGVFCRGLMLGEGPLKGAIETRIRTLGLEDHFRVAFVANPEVELAQVSIYLSLQTGDNYPSQALLEAMGAGCAVIASDVGETRTLVTPAVGICCALDVNSIAAAIARMVHDPLRTRAMGNAAAARARDEFSADSYIANIESLYVQAVRHFEVGSPDSGR